MSYQPVCKVGEADLRNQTIQGASMSWNEIQNCSRRTVDHIRIIELNTRHLEGWYRARSSSLQLDEIGPPWFLTLLVSKYGDNLPCCDYQEEACVTAKRCAFSDCLIDMWREKFVRFCGWLVSFAGPFKKRRMVLARRSL